MAKKYGCAGSHASQYTVTAICIKYQTPGKQFFKQTIIIIKAKFRVLDS